MTRGNAIQSKVHFKGTETQEDFIVFVQDIETLKKWKGGDKTIPISDIVSGWKVYTSGKQGNQGILGEASNAMLDNEFGSHKEEYVVEQILEKGDPMEKENAERGGDRNITAGPSIAH